MNRSVLLAIILSLLVPGSTSAIEGSVEHIYEIFIGSKFIGELSAVRRQQADSVVYLITSDINAQVGIKLVQDYRLESVYRNGSLARSEIFNVINEKVRADTKIFREGERYVALKEDSSILDIGPVDYSIVRMFFTEPEGQDSVFSENFAEDLVCNPEENEQLSKYCLYLPDCTRIEYFYNKGICEQFEVRLVIFNIRYSLKKVKTLP